MQFIYLILSIYLGKKNPLFFLLFPLALMQGTGAFITENTAIILPQFFISTRNIFKDITILYLIIVVFSLRKKIDLRLIIKSPMWLFFIYIVFLSVYTISTYGLQFEAINAIRYFIYLPLGYFLLLQIISESTLRNFNQFMQSMLWINIVQSVLYALNSSKIIPIFESGSMYLEIESGNVSFYRDFLTIPVLSKLMFLFSFANLVLNNRTYNKYSIYGTLFIYPLVILFSFTRSILISTIFELVIVIFIILFYQPDKIIGKYSISVILVALFLTPLLHVTFNTQLNFFSDRIVAAKNEGKNEENVYLRRQYHERAFQILNRENSLMTGYALNKKPESQMEKISQGWVTDSTIPFLLIYTGLIGTIIFFWIQFYFAYICYKNRFGQLNPLAMTVFALIVSGLISSVIMGGNPWGSPLFYLYHAIVIYFINNKSFEVKEFIEEISRMEQTQQLLEAIVTDYPKSDSDNIN